MWKKHLTLQSPLPVHTILADLERETDERQLTMLSLSGYKGKKLFLFRVERDGLSLRKRIFYRNSFARHLYARLATGSGGTQLDTTFAMSSPVQIFMFVWFSLAALFEITSFAITARALFTPGTRFVFEDYLLFLVPTGMLLFGYLLISFGLYLSRSDEREMLVFLEQVVSASAVSSGSTGGVPPMRRSAQINASPVD